MTAIANHSTALRSSLLIDAIASGAMGVLLSAGATPLAPLLGLPEGLLRAVGIILLPFATFLVWLAPRASELRVVVQWVAGLNVLWVLASVLLLVSGRVEPTPPGTVFVIVQAAAVAVFAFLENRAAAHRDPATAAVRSTASGR